MMRRLLLLMLRKRFMLRALLIFQKLMLQWLLLQ
jgi:hypothetical protein